LNIARLGKSVQVFLGFLFCCVLTSCALLNPPAPEQAALKQIGHWQGRLSLRVLKSTPEQFSANFELNGSADTGELTLYSPLGTTLAVVNWSPQNAQLMQGQKVQKFESMDALTKELTGAAIPLQAMLSWLDIDGPSLPGWQLNAETSTNGRRIVAKREEPSPALQLTLLVDPP
jgi:outer membrane lipoprotein LolB